jgi:hypothetical protein
MNITRDDIEFIMIAFIFGKVVGDMIGYAIYRLR